MFKLLLKVRFQAMFSSLLKSNNGEKQSSKNTIILVALVLAFFFAIMCFGVSAMFLGIAVSLNGSEIKWIYFALAGVVAFFFSLLFVVFITSPQLYDSKENMMLLSMPVPANYILLSRMVFLWIVTMAIQYLILLPAGIIYFIVISFSAYQLMAFILLLIALPLLSLALSCILGWVYSFIISKLRYKNIIVGIISILFLAGYLFVCFSLDSYVTYLIENIGAVSVFAKKYLFLFYWLGIGFSSKNFLWLLLFIAICIIPFALVFFVLSKTFISTITNKKSGKRLEYKKQELKVSSSMVALIKKELKHFFGSPVYLVNCGIGVIFTVIAVVMFVLKLPDLLEMLKTEELAFLKGGIPYIAIAMLCVMSSMDCISAPSVSVEAKNIWITQSCPIDAKDIIMSKAYTHMIVCMPVNLISSIVISCLIPFNFLDLVLLILTPNIYVALSAIAGVAINVKFPKLDAISETIAVKQSGSVAIAMLGGMMVVVIGVVLGLVSSMLISFAVYTFIATLIMLVGYYLIYLWICKKGAKIYQYLSSN